MTIAQCFTDSFKLELSQGIHNLATDVFYIALYTSAATLDNTTTAYSTFNEISGIGYTPGGQILGGVTVGMSNNVVYYDYMDPAWVLASFTARGALIYNASKSNRSVAVLDFGTDKVASGNTFTVTLPPNTFTQALIRI